MTKAVSTLIELFYLIRRNVIDEAAVDQIQSTLDRFYHHREIFHDVNICPDGFSLPRQHSLCHYVFSITQFGAPNGLCSSITESKHRKVVKEPFCCSNNNQAMGQILVTNQRLNKISAARVYFVACGMLKGPSSTTGMISGLHPGLTNHEQPSDELGPQVTQRTWPATARHSDSERDTDSAFWNRKRHDSRAEDDPKADAEISLSKTYGVYFFRIFCLHNLRFFPV